MSWFGNISWDMPILWFFNNCNVVFFISMRKSSNKLVCEPCQMDKSLSLPFSVSESFTVEPLAKIHCDLWGPSPIEFVQGFRYYVVFIDAFSRFRWFYPLRIKSDFYEIFCCFKILWRIRSTKISKCFRVMGVVNL